MRLGQTAEIPAGGGREGVAAGPDGQDELLRPRFPTQCNGGLGEIRGVG